MSLHLKVADDYAILTRSDASDFHWKIKTGEPTNEDIILSEDLIGQLKEFDNLSTNQVFAVIAFLSEANKPTTKSQISSFICLNPTQDRVFTINDLFKVSGKVLTSCRSRINHPSSYPNHAMQESICITIIDTPCIAQHKTPGRKFGGAKSIWNEFCGIAYSGYQYGLSEKNNKKKKKKPKATLKMGAKRKGYQISSGHGRRKLRKCSMNDLVFSYVQELAYYRCGQMADLNISRVPDAFKVPFTAEMLASAYDKIGADLMEEGFDTNTVRDKMNLLSSCLYEDIGWNMKRSKQQKANILPARFDIDQVFIPL